MKKQLLFVGKIVVSLSILFFLFKKIGLQNIVDVFKEFRVVHVALVVVMFFVIVFLGACNLKLLSNLPKRNISFSALFKYTLLSWSLGFFLPGKLGEFSLIYFMKKEGYKVGESTALSLVDKGITVFVLLILSIYGLLTYTDISLSILALIVAFIVLVIIVFLSDVGRHIVKKVLKKYADMFSGFSKTAFYYLKKEKIALAINVLLTGIKYVVVAIVIKFLLDFFGFSVDFFVILSINAAATLLSLVPISFSGIGVRESFAVVVYNELGVSSSVVFSVYLLFSIVSYAIAAFAILLLKTSKEEKN